MQKEISEYSNPIRGEFSRAQIESFESIQRKTVLYDWVKGGKPMIVDIYFNPENFQAFEIEVDGHQFRKTSVPHDKHEVLPMGKWELLKLP